MTDTVSSNTPLEEDSSITAVSSTSSAEIATRDGLSAVTDSNKLPDASNTHEGGDSEKDHVVVEDTVQPNASRIFQPSETEQKDSDSQSLDTDVVVSSNAPIASLNGKLVEKYVLDLPSPPQEVTTGSSKTFIAVSPTSPPPIPAQKVRLPSGSTNPSQLSISEGVISPSSSNGHQRSLTISHGNVLSVVFISSALETLAASKEVRRSAAFKQSVEHALELIKTGEAGIKPREIFEPLRLACETGNEKLMIVSLDCISKLISHAFFVQQNDTSSSLNIHAPSSQSQESLETTSGQSLVDMVAHTITACYTESTPDAVSLQIVKALLALVLSPALLIHHSSLLKAIRTVYNIFLLSNDPVNQTVAQGGLTQMVNHVFSRCQADGWSSRHSESIGQSRRSSSSRNVASPRRESVQPSTPDSSLPPSTPVQITRPSLDTRIISGNSSEDNVDSIQGESVASEVTSSRDGGDVNPIQHEETNKSSNSHISSIPEPNYHAFESPNRHDSFAESERDIEPHQLATRDLFIKDAFLVFRALCKLTMKPLNNESERDPKSHAMRSKLLSLHLVLLVLNSYMHIFVDPSSIVYSSSSNETTTIIEASKQYLCLSVSRNALSPVSQVFETSVEIFWRILSGMRNKLKKEIEVFLHEIFIPILEMKTSTMRQKSIILSMLWKLCQEPQALVEIYLNYDCDREAADNIYEHLMNVISKMSTTHFHQSQRNEPQNPPSTPIAKSQPINGPPSLSTTALATPTNSDSSANPPSDQLLRRQGLECLCAVLRSLVVWGTAARKANSESIAENGQAEQLARVNGMNSNPSLENLSVAGTSDPSRVATPDMADDPGRFESAKQRKTILLEGLKKFNFKPKRGIAFLLENGFIPSNTPHDIARFLLNTEGLNKAMVGEYMGEGDPVNVAIMHAFVDQLDFTSLPFVDALRLFLQSFRLPGESQKIDRYMLKFSERYIACNLQTPFANADAAYVLSYSIIMLNTDAHNPQVKRRMTKADFIRNLRGINDNADLPEDLLSSIYDNIQSNEIVMKDEVEAKLVLPGSGPGIANALANVGRDLQKEAYVLQSHGMASKTEALLRTLMRTQRKGPKGSDQFFSASHFVHVRPMFEVAWIPFLAGLSGPLQDTDDMEVVELCLEGFKNAIKIVCFFDLELERNAFVTTLAKFTFLNNLGEMKAKNMEAIKALLDIAVTEGNQLKGSWHEVLTCVSQLERMQLISSGIDIAESGRKGRGKKLPAEELANESRSTHITVAADMVFSLSHYLSGTAIVDFVRALSSVSWEEIQSSGLSEHPRLFSLQKLVEISYYNMNRIRLEWSNLWEILGEHFNQVCCHHNTHVGIFALDALRQLAMRFLEKEELPHFKFQKDFLKPFEYTMIHNSNPEIRDMVLQCLQQMIQARVQNMRSGWRTMFGVFSAASKVSTERIVSSSFEIITRLNEEQFAAIVRYGSFADLTICITDFCKVSKYQKISLLAIGMLRRVIPKMLECPDCSLSEAYLAESTQPISMDESTVKFWFPVLFSYYDIIMNAEDLEIRRLALDSMFSTLKTYGQTFPVEFWDTICRELLFPIFAVLKSSSDLSRWSTQEDMSVWLSTTMIQALRDLISLYTHFFGTLERFLDGLLELLCVCICQENDTLARIGTSCLQQLLEKNVQKLSPTRWEQIATTFIRLFKTTTPHQLFDESLRAEIEENPGELSESPDMTQQAILPAPLPSSDSTKANMKITQVERRKIFKQIIVKCVLQLLLIETTSELLQNQDVYNTIPPEHLLRLMGVLDHSYQFARDFNEDKELRTALWKVGFMKHLPNLLKQETSSAATLVNVLLRMYFDTRPGYQALRPQVAEKLLPLSLGVIKDYNKLRSESQLKNIAAWTPVVAEILHGFSRFDEKTFGRYLPALYTPATELLAKDLSPEVRLGLRDYLLRVGRAQGLLEQL